MGVVDREKIKAFLFQYNYWPNPVKGAAEADAPPSDPARAEALAQAEVAPETTPLEDEAHAEAARVREGGARRARSAHERQSRSATDPFRA